jgi:hypothetical protein
MNKKKVDANPTNTFCQAAVLKLLSAAAFTTILSVEPSFLTGLETGKSFAVNITVTNVTGLYGWQFALYYKSPILNATQV